MQTDKIIIDGGNMPGIEVRNLGSRLRLARRHKRMRLLDVAKAVGCSESLLSKIECEKATPSLKILHRIAAALDTSIGSLFEEPDSNDVVTYRSGERPVVIINGKNEKESIRLERLIPLTKGRSLSGNIHIVAPGTTNGGDIKHEGEEVGYVIEGQFELTVGDKTYHMKAGDSFFFPSEIPHRYRNTSSSMTRVLWINTPPTF